MRAILAAALGLVLAGTLATSAWARCACSDDSHTSRAVETESDTRCCREPWERLTLDYKREKESEREVRRRARAAEPKQPPRACTCRLCGCNPGRAGAKDDADDCGCAECSQNHDTASKGTCTKCGGRSSNNATPCDCHGGKSRDDKTDTAAGWTEADWRDRHSGTSFLRDSDR